jgi:hypothetical protein
MLQFVQCKFFMAALIFAALTVLAGAGKFGSLPPDQFPYRSWTAWTIEDFLKQPQTPDVVFLGSSLVLVPVAGVDADYLKQRLDGATHHESLYFDQVFGNKSGMPVRSFNFALPGEMPSDACLIANFLLKQPRTPALVIYGVGPRDFMDNLLPSPSSTDPFHFLSRFGDISQWASLLMPDWVDRMNYELGRAVYLYGNKCDIAISLATGLSSALNEVLPPVTLSDADKAALVHTLLPTYKPFALNRGEAFFRPLTAAEAAKFTDNLEEYRKRYKTLRKDTFNTQMSFFADTLAAAKRQGAHCVVVAMPITDLNRSLLSDRNWHAYRQGVQAVANKEGAAFVDFSDDHTFQRTDFCDTVHLHAGGGRKWMDKLIARLASDPTVVSEIKADKEGIRLSGRGGTL